MNGERNMRTLESEMDMLAVLDFDRTRHPRVERLFDVDCVVEDGKKIFGLVQNISVKGVRATFDKPLPLGNPLLLRVWFPDDPEMESLARYLDAHVEIVWAKPDDCDYGMAFLTMDLAGQEWLSRFVERYVATGG